MKVALIGDIHANLPALEAVLAHARAHGVDEVWNVGDSVGYGAFPDEVVAGLRQENVVSIAGNYDLKVLRWKERRDKWEKSKVPEKWLAFRWAYENLSRESRQYLRSLPEEVRLEVDGKRVILTHASPGSNEQPLTPDTPLERLRELARTAGADIVIAGHSHQPFRRKVDGVWFINTGSVGRPDDGDPRACYAVLSFKPRYFRLRHYRVAYDVERAAAALRERGLPEAFAQMVLEGRSLDAVAGQGVLPQSPVQAGGAEIVPGEVVENGPEPYVVDEETEERHLQAVLLLAQSCQYEVDHTHHVTRLALELFDQLQPVHYLGAVERLWLRAAAMLHDIGWIEGQTGHHKTTLRIILNSPALLFDARERLIVGSVARYHRGALPAERHSHFAALDPAGRHTVLVLAALLRVADGLDCRHERVVQSITCEVLPGAIVVRGNVNQPAEDERLEALDKGALFEQVFGRQLMVSWQRA